MSGLPANAAELFEVVNDGELPDEAINALANLLLNLDPGESQNAATTPEADKNAQ